MAHRLTLARYVALLYAGVVGLFQLINVLNIALHAPEEWRKAVGHTLIGIVAALIPLAALTIGRRFATRSPAHGILAVGAIGACVLPFAVAVLLMFSTEPLAMLALLYVPPAQGFLLAGVLGATAFANRKQS